MINYFLPSLALLLALVYGSNAHAQSIRDDSLKVACMTAAKLSGNEADEQWCQCQNDYYADLLTDEDWQTYTNDYYALARKQASTESTPANSYARHVQLGNSHCRKCKKDGYQHCLENDGKTPNSAAYSQIYSSLRNGEFSELSKSLLFKRFYVDFLHGYSAFCGNALQNYTLRTITSTEWKYQNHIWWEGDTHVSQVRVANKHYMSFTRYEDELASDISVTYFKDLFEAKKEGRMPWKSAEKVINATVNSVAFMRDTLSGQCASQDVAAVYENLYRFNNNEAPYINPIFEQQRQALETAEKRKYAHIIEATKASQLNSIKVYAQQREIEAAKTKVTMSCPNLYKESAEKATTLKSFTSTEGASYKSIEGAWKGDLNGDTIEVIAWPGYASGDVLPGMAYFPQYDCLMSVLFSSKSRVGNKRNVASLEFSMYSPNWRPTNCESMVKYDRDKEIHFFNVRGFLQFVPNANSFTYFPSNTKLGAITPQQCNGLAVDFTKGKISEAFYQVLKKYKHPDKRGPKLTDAFLEGAR